MNVADGGLPELDGIRIADGGLEASRKRSGLTLML